MRLLVVLRGAAIAAILAWLLIPQIHAQTQAATNAQARAEFKQADAELNKTYQAVLKNLPDAESKQKLKETQRAWIASRDAEATRAAGEVRGGSMAPTLRYTTMTELTQQRIKQLKTGPTHDAVPDEKDASTPSPASTATASASPQESDEQPAAAEPNSSSVSPDKKWKYNCGEYGLGNCYPEIVKDGTTVRVVDLDRELDVSGNDSSAGEVLWTPDSKRFAFNYSPIHAHHTTYKTVAFYQLSDDQWVALHSPIDAESDRAQLAQLAKDYLPKAFNARHCAPEWDELKWRNWTDANTGILYAPCYDRSRELKAAFLLTLKFDDAGNWEIVRTHQLSKEELKEEQ